MNRCSQKIIALLLTLSLVVISNGQQQTPVNKTDEIISNFDSWHSVTGHARIKFDPEYKISIENLRSGRITITGWDKDIIEAKVKSKDGDGMLNISALHNKDKVLFIKADYKSGEFFKKTKEKEQQVKEQEQQKKDVEAEKKKQTERLKEQEQQKKDVEAENKKQTENLKEQRGKLKEQEPKEQEPKKPKGRTDDNESTEKPSPSPSPTPTPSNPPNTSKDSTQSKTPSVSNSSNAPNPKISDKRPSEPRIKSPSQVGKGSIQPVVPVKIQPSFENKEEVPLNFEIKLPRNAELLPISARQNDVEVREIDSPIQITGVQGNITLINTGAAKVSTKLGNVESADAKGHLNITTVSGNVNVRNANGNVRVLTLNGDINISCVSERVHATSTNGNINLMNVMEDVDAESASSPITFIGAIRKDTRYKMKSLSGRIEMRIQAEPPGFTANLSSYRNTVESGFNFKMFQTSSNKEKKDNNPLTSEEQLIGIYGDGKAVITLNSFNGEVILRKAIGVELTKCPD